MKLHKSTKTKLLLALQNTVLMVGLIATSNLHRIFNYVFYGLLVGGIFIAIYALVKNKSLLLRESSPDKDESTAI